VVGRRRPAGGGSVWSSGPVGYWNPGGGVYDRPFRRPRPSEQDAAILAVAMGSGLLFAVCALAGLRLRSRRHRRSRTSTSWSGQSTCARSSERTRKAADGLLKQVLD